MDRAIWATWYDLPAEGANEYISWLHEVHLPEMLERTGYLWAAHVDNDKSEERRENVNRRLTHTDDPFRADRQRVPDAFRRRERPHVSESLSCATGRKLGAG